MKTYLLVFIVAFTALFTKAQGIEFEHDKSFDELLKKAKAEDKLIFMDCYTAWCGPCKRLAAQVFPDPKVGEYFNANFVNSKFDMEKGEGPSIATRYGIRAYPTLLWIDGDGIVKHKVVGGLDPDGLIQAGKKAADPMPGVLDKYKKMYKDGNRETAFLSDYLNSQNSDGSVDDKVLKEFIDGMSEKDKVSDTYMKTIFNSTQHIESPGVSVLQKDKALFVEKMGLDKYNSKINALATKAAKDAGLKKNPALYDQAIALLKQNKAPDAQKQILLLNMERSIANNNWKGYEKAAATYLKKFEPNNPLKLNDAAWLFFLNVDNPSSLKKAEKWALKSIQIDNKYTYNLTYAYLLFKQKKYAEAEKACDYAIIRANEERVSPSSAQSLKDNLKNRAVPK